jgi:hypothetical protein
VKRAIAAVTLAAAITLSTCGKLQERIASEPARQQKLPTATEVFNLRTKCAELGRQLDAKQSYDSSDTYRETLSNYSIKTNRCYVTLTDSSTLSAVRRTHKRIHDVDLYDGQTWELLATTSDGPNGKTGTVSGDSNIEDCSSSSDCGYSKAQAYIDERMKREE